jgi:hypothetical protein
MRKEFLLLPISDANIRRGGNANKSGLDRANSARQQLKGGRCIGRR